MSSSHAPTHYPYPVAYAPTPYVPVAEGPANACAEVINMALVGALIGGSAAAASNAIAMTHQQMNLGQALRETGRAALASSVATAVGGVVANTVSDQGLMRLSLMFGVGAAVLYGIHYWNKKQESSHE